MSFRPAMVLAAAICATTASAARKEPGLPVWSEGELAELEKNGWVAGGLLLTDESPPEETLPDVGEPLGLARPTAAELAEPASLANEIPEQFWPAYFDARPKSFLVDPQGLLSPVDYRDRLGFLNYHSSDSTIDLFVYVFKGDQEIPGEVREEEIVERFFTEGRPAAIVYYYLGAPQRSALYLSPSITDTVSAAEQRRAMESSMMQAFKNVDPSRQIEGFLVQMSIRIYWMERMLEGESEAGGEAMPPVARRVEAPEENPGVMESMRPALQSVEHLAFPAAVLAGVLFPALGAGTWLRRRARYRFPDFEVEPRLGGAHAAGVGAVISFASAAVPPASQRDQVPDYLRRA